jgi:hypothetical protein
MWLMHMISLQHLALLSEFFTILFLFYLFVYFSVRADREARIVATVEQVSAGTSEGAAVPPAPKTGAKRRRKE